MAAVRQLALALEHRPALGASDFLVAAANRDAVAWIDRWPDWPATALVLHGPPACGKSHLVAVWCARAGAPALAAAHLGALGPEAALAGHPGLAIEDADRGVDETALFHLFNMATERRLKLLLSGRAPPGRWRIALPDLDSRLSALPAVGIAAPDDDLLAAVIVKLFADRQLDVAADVVEFLLARIERSFAAAGRVVDALDRAAMARRRRVTVALAREILPELSTGQTDKGGE
jgi:chromosomal replication initiation ATPase DnaA